jgi:uncharacterized protein (DUF983 family)
MPALKRSQIVSQLLPPSPAASAPYQRWQPGPEPRRSSWPVPPLATALLRGWRGRCPACGQSRLFQGYLRVEPECPHCTAPLGLARADDAPPYFTLLLVGHLIIPALFIVERSWQPAIWVEAAIFLPATLVLTLLLLRPIKGATVGLMLRFGMLKSDRDE